MIRHIVCNNDDCEAGSVAGAEGYWVSVLSERVDVEPDHCPVCGSPNIDVAEADEEEVCPGADG